MQRWLGSIVGLGLLVWSGNPACAALVKPVWLNDYEAGKAEARRTGKPMLLVFRCQP
jgi:hypothetical protein